MEIEELGNYCHSQSKRWYDFTALVTEKLEDTFQMYLKIEPPTVTGGLME